MLLTAVFVSGDGEVWDPSYSHFTRSHWHVSCTYPYSIFRLKISPCSSFPVEWVQQMVLVSRSSFSSIIMLLKHSQAVFASMPSWHQLPLTQTGKETQAITCNFSSNCDIASSLTYLLPMTLVSITLSFPSLVTHILHALAHFLLETAHM